MRWRRSIIFAVALGVGLALPVSSHGEEFRVDRLIIDAPDGGMTAVAPAASRAEFAWRGEITMTAEVAGAGHDRSWQRSCTPQTGDTAAAPLYRLGRLARNDAYLYAVVSRDRKNGVSTAKGLWRQHCLVFRSGELAARISIELPPSALDTGGMTVSDIERVLSGTKLLAASIEGPLISDPRLSFEWPGDFKPAAQPTFSFYSRHNRLPLSMTVSLGDPARYEFDKLEGTISAMPWKVGTLARSDEHFFITLWPYSPKFVLGFRAAETSARISVDIERRSPDNGDIDVAAIERMLSSARLAVADRSNQGR